MSNKKGFTVVELIIVLIAIGVIASLAIPAAVRNITQTQYKTSYKKALHAINTIALNAKLTNELTISNLSRDTMILFKALNDNLNATAYVSDQASPVNSGITIKPSDYAGAITINDIEYGAGTSAGSVTPYSITTFGPSPWIITEDNMAFSVMCGGQTGVPAPCSTRGQIAKETTQKNAVLKSCTIVIVDVNGLSKGPNRFEPQISTTAGFKINDHVSPFSIDSTLQPLTGDQYIIFLGSNGATPGHREATLTGRISSGEI